MIILIGLELLTGNFGVVPLVVLVNRTTVGRMLANWFWVVVSDMLGSLLYAAPFYVVLTHVNDSGAGALGDHIGALAESKSITHVPGRDGLMTAFVEAMLCNWMDCLAVVVGNSFKSQFGRIIGCWLPIFALFALRLIPGTA